jgi:phage baseplate assembly protein W
MTELYTKTVIPQNNFPPSHSVQRYRGFSTISSATTNFALYDFALIKQDLLNHFYIRQGERLMQPNFGTVIWDLLFEPLTPDIQNAILTNVNQIFNSDPRIQAENILITPYETGLQIQCDLKYLLYNIQEKLQLNFDQANGLLSQ